MASSGSSRPLVSSLRIRSATWMPKPVPTSAIVSIVTAKYWSTMSPAPEPSSFSISSLSPSRLLASRPVRPSETPLRNRPALQPISTPRWSRTASPSGLSSRRCAVAGPGRWARMPAPSSRWARSATAPAHEPGGGDDHQRERPPLLVGVGPHVLAPADRREPRQRAVADVAGRAQQVGGAERGAGDPVHRRGRLADLRRHRGDAGEHEPDAGQRGAERERARGRLVEADHRRARRAGRAAAAPR